MPLLWFSDSQFVSNTVGVWIFSAYDLHICSHNLGAARCSSFKDYLSNFESAQNIDPTLYSRFANTLSKACSLGDNMEVAFGPTRTSFDNTYLKALRTGDGVLTTAKTLFASPQMRNHINGYVMNQVMFFNFLQALLKMRMIDVKKGNQGKVRIYCCKVN